MQSSLFLLILVVGAAVRNPAAAQQVLSDSLGVTLEAGDALRIVVWGRDELSGDFEITSDGRVAHPLLQELEVLGRSFEQVRADVFIYLSRFQNQPQAVVTPLRRISVGGAVTTPGVVAIDPRQRLLDAIGLAGGPTDETSFDKVRLVRGGEDETVQLWGSGAAEETLLSLNLRSGDQVVVPFRKSFWRDYLMPGAAIITPLVTITNLILQISRP